MNYLVKYFYLVSAVLLSASSALANDSYHYGMPGTIVIGGEGGFIRKCENGSCNSNMHPSDAKYQGNPVFKLNEGDIVEIGFVDNNNCFQKSLYVSYINNNFSVGNSYFTVQAPPTPTNANRGWNSKEASKQTTVYNIGPVISMNGQISTQYSGYYEVNIFNAVNIYKIGQPHTLGNIVMGESTLFPFYFEVNSGSETNCSTLSHPPAQTPVFMVKKFEKK